MPTIMGTWNSGTTRGVQDWDKKSFAQTITRLMPNGMATLFGLSGLLKSENAINIEHGFYSKALLFPSATLTAAVADGVATTFTAASTANLLPNMILRAQSTGENVLVLTVPTPTTFTVQRGLGTVAAAAIGNGTSLYKVGTAFEEASIRPTAMSITPVRITNWTQIFRNTWMVSGTAAAIPVIAGESVTAENKQDCVQFHSTDIETMLFFGQKSTGTKNGQPFRTADGLISIVGNLAYYPAGTASPNIYTAAATTNWTQLENMLDPVFNQTTDHSSGNERTIFCGATAMRVFNQIGRLNGTYELMDGQTSWGLQFRTLKTTRGVFKIVEHPLFNTTPEWSKLAVVVDLPTFTTAYLGDRKTKHTPLATDTNLDAEGGTLLTEMTTVVKNPPANAVIWGLTAGAQG